MVLQSLEVVTERMGGQNRGGALLMISPPAVGLGWSWRSERGGGERGGGGREEQWQRKQNGL